MKRPLKNTYFSIIRKLPPRYRFGKTFWETYKFLAESQWWSKEKIREYQLREIQRLLQHSYKYVPYYKTLFDEHGIDPAKVKDFDDFHKIPYLTRTLVNKYGTQLKSSIHTKLRPATTSGTSGKTMQFWRDYNENTPREKAIVWRMWNLYGYSWDDKSVIIKGNLKIQSKAIIYNPADRSLGIYNPVFSRENLNDYLKLIDDHKPVGIRGYPSLLYSLAHIILSSGKKVRWPWLRLIYCHSEQVFSSQKETIEAAFNVKVRYNYGHTERCVFMHVCELNDDYHILPEYGYTEFIPGSGDSSIGEIVATGFYNYGFPFIRYRTRDWATLPHADACMCGRNFSLVKLIHGRAGDFIVTPSGGFVSPTILEMGREIVSNYKDILILQHDKNSIEVKIVPDEGYSATVEHKLKDFLQKRIGEPMRIEIKPVDNINRIGTDKKRFVISEIADKYLHNK